MFWPDKIVVHHSLTKDGVEVSWGAIRNFHITTHDGNYGWLDIGYHAGIELVKSGDYLNYEVLFGRPWDMQGAHCPAVNATSLGFCFVGNYDLIEPPQEMLVSAAKFLRQWMVLYAIPKTSIFPHSKYDPKTCPGSKFDLQRLLSLLP
jgi:hypothetical protein